MGMGDDYYLILFTLSLLFGIAFAFIFVLHHILVGSEPNGIPEGRAGWPIIGETIGFLRPHRSNSMGKFLQDHCAMHGKVYLSHLFGTQTIVSCDYELNSFILRNEERLFECNYPKPIHEILGKLSLLAFGGDMHKKLRVALGLINSWRSNVCHLHDINKQVISILKSWEHKERIIFCNEARKFTFSVILKQTLSMGPEEPLSTRILLDFLTFMKGLVSFPLYIPGTSYAKAVKARARISSTVLAIVQERKKRGVKNRKCDFLDVLLSNGSLNDGEKVSLVLDILHGGYETTSTLLAMALYFLGRSPLALMQLKEEHLSTRRRKKEEHLDWEDYKQMLFTQNVIQEALRCGNIVKFVHRRAREDVRFKGYLIPSGWKVLPVFSAVHLDPSLHENASEYFPWRWEMESR